MLSRKADQRQGVLKDMELGHRQLWRLGQKHQPQGSGGLKQPRSSGHQLSVPVFSCKDELLLHFIASCPPHELVSCRSATFNLLWEKKCFGGGY